MATSLVPFFKGDVKELPRRDFIYWNDDGQLVAIRVDEWKTVFLEQNNKGMGVWQGQFNTLRLPELFNLRADPFVRGDELILYDKWVIDHAFVQFPDAGASTPLAGSQVSRIFRSGKVRELQSRSDHGDDGSGIKRSALRSRRCRCLLWANSGHLVALSTLREIALETRLQSSEGYFQKAASSQQR